MSRGTSPDVSRGTSREADGPRTVALVVAHDEEGRVGSCVGALGPLVDRVIVVDDGSADGTAEEALAAGAAVIRTPRRRGKGRALEGALRRLPEAERWLLADGDLAGTAGGLGALLAALDDGADLAIAAFPPGQGGGFGVVKRFASASIGVLTGFDAAAPLSGQRALSARALSAARPLAAGFGVETGMTIDILRAGLRVVEVPIPGLGHRATRRDLPGFVHRGRQGLHIAAAVIARALGLR